MTAKRRAIARDGAAGTAAEPALELRDVSKRFGETVALDRASIVARCGRVHALLGENGAGKTTLMRIAYGMLRPDAGEMIVDGVWREFVSPADAIGAGIGMVHQHFTLVPAMTVAENIALGGRGVLNPRVAREHAAEASRRTGLALEPEAIVADLPVGAQQRVEILKALNRGARTLILDEPTAVLTPGESRELMERVRALAAAGTAVIIITHRLRDALAFADDITVLRRGIAVWSGDAAGATERSLADLMVGGGEAAPLVRESDVERATERGSAQGATDAASGAIMRLSDVTVVENHRAVLEHVSLDVRGGEIVGVAAVEGNGEGVLLRVLAGRIRPSSGIAVLPAVVGFAPADRQRDALIGELDLAENVALAGAGTRHGVMDWARERARTAELLRAYDVRASGAGALARTLSGGNQQKLVLGRELEHAREAIVAEHPSRGLDFAATIAVHERLRTARARRMAVVVHSPDLDELLALADRIVVMHRGRMMAAPPDREAIGRMMLGAA